MKYEDDIHNCTNERLAEMLDEYNDWRRGKLPYDQPGCPAPIKASGLGVLLDEISARLRTKNKEQFNSEAFE